jgi:hypothetical protein
MYFLPQGQYDRKPGTKCLDVFSACHSYDPKGLQFRHLQKVMSGNLPPKGQEDSAQGFNPWEPTTQSDAP